MNNWTGVIILLLLIYFAPFLFSLFGRWFLAFVTFLFSAASVWFDYLGLFKPPGYKPLIYSLVIIWCAAWIVAIYSIATKGRFRSRKAIRWIYKENSNNARGKNAAMWS
jgi:hypothetical protein